MGSTEGMMRGLEVVDTGEPISVPVGQEALGRVFNVLGEPIDKRGDVNTKERWAIHRKAPPVNELSTNTELFETGIKVVDLLTPFVRGGKAGLFGGAGLGKTVILTELIARIASSSRWLLRVRWALASERVKAPTFGWKCKTPKSAPPVVR